MPPAERREDGERDGLHDAGSPLMARLRTTRADREFPPPIIERWLRHHPVPTDDLVQELDYWARKMAGDSAGPHYIAAYQSTIHESSETRGEDCAHESATGITEYAGPEKIWRCDGCGYLYASYTDDDGITVDYPVLSPIRSGGEGS